MIGRSILFVMFLVCPVAAGPSGLNAPAAAGPGAPNTPNEPGTVHETAAAEAAPQAASEGALPWWVQPGFTLDVVATGFTLPVNIAFVPNPGSDPGDPYFYVTELYGTVKVVTRDLTVHEYAAELLNYLPTGIIPGSGEQGLTGIVVDPFTGDVLVSELYDSPFEPGIHYPMVLRLHSEDGGLTAASASVLLDMFGELQGEAHQVSTLSIGPDGRLYVHMGDGFITSAAQDLASFRGKILRLNLDGWPAGDNPFFFSPDGITATDYVYAYGFRNPFGGAWRAVDGLLYEVENGPFIDRFAKVVPGRNYLWDGTDASMLNSALFAWYPSVAPVNLVFVQPETFGGSGFPADRMGRAYVSESGIPWTTGVVEHGKRISEFVLDAGGNVLAGPAPLVEYTGTGKASVIALAAGPDGLYFSDFYKDQDAVAPTDPGANILRVCFVGAADFTANVTTGTAPLTVQFSDTSTVPDPTAWSWDFGDGGTAATPSPVHTYTSDGSYDVELRVTGANGVSVSHKPDFIRVGRFPRAAMLVGLLPASLGDQGMVDRLRSLGWVVDVYDDDPALRPTGLELAEAYDLVLISSSIASESVADEFRWLPVPVIYWNPALNAVDREPLAAFGDVVGSATTISVLDTGHPITEGLALGPLEVLDLPGVINGARGPVGPGVRVLAMSGESPETIAVMVADIGAGLLGGHTAMGRRVSLFFSNFNWLTATEAGRAIFDRSVAWAAGPTCPGERVVLYVDGRAPAGGDCLSWSTACRDLQDALLGAAVIEEPVEIWVAEGVYLPDRGTGSPDSTFALQNCVSMYGGFRGAYGPGGFPGEQSVDERVLGQYPTVLSGDIGVSAIATDNCYHVVSSFGNDPTAILDGFWIIGGNADGTTFPSSYGGGLLAVESSPWVRGCVFAWNFAGIGGGVHQQGGRMVVSDCAFVGNVAGWGAGLANGAGTPIVTRCTFAWNLDTFGCGFSDWSGTAILDGDNFLFNFCSVE